MKKLAKYQPVLSLKPTQFSIGMVEIQYKVKKMLKMKKRDLKRYIDEHPVPVVLSPWNELCITDHHHFLFACWHANVKKVRVKMVRDFSQQKMSYVSFWKKMAKLNYAYLIDQFGNGPQSPLYLPSDIRGVADDPYRSLAWIVRKEGGLEKSKASFAEFLWANYFRKHNLLNNQGKDGIKKAVGRAITLAKSQEAKNLPGYISQRKLQDALNETHAKTMYIVKDEAKGPLATTPDIKVDKKEKSEKLEARA